MTQHTSIKSMTHGERSGWWVAYLRHRYGVLFYSLLLTLVGDPILKAFGGTGDVLLLFVVLNLLAAALQLDNKKGRTTLLSSLRYVESLSAARTPLADFINSLLARWSLFGYKNRAALVTAGRSGRLNARVER